MTVSVDGETLVRKLDGKSLPIDPGPHTFKFETAGAPPVVERALVKEGEKTRVITVTFEPPLRIALTNGSAVAWDRPVAHYKVINDSFALNWEPGYLAKGSLALDLLEQWT